MGSKLATPGGSRGKISLNAEPNIIPFIDVMLVLLIIFMVAAPIASVDVQVDLPDSKVLPSKRPNKPTYVSLQDQGTAGIKLFVGNDEVTEQTLGAKTYDEVQKNERRAITEADRLQTRIYIRGQDSTQYRNIVLVMNRLQDRGFYKVALVAEDKRR